MRSISRWPREGGADTTADVNAQGGQYDNALQEASIGGHEKVVQMLLDRGAGVNIQRCNNNPHMQHQQVAMRRLCRCFSIGGSTSMLKEENMAMPYVQHQQVAMRR